MTLGQRLCVLDLGHVMQIGSPMELYQRPSHRFVGDFIGTPGMNFVRGCLEERDGGMVFVERSGKGDGFVLVLDGDFAKRLAVHNGREVELGIRPEHLLVTDYERGISAMVESCETLGHESLLRVRSSGHELVVRVAGAGAAGLAQVGLEFDLEAAAWFDADSGQALD